MSPDVKPIPEGYPVISPSLVVRGGAKALEWYQTVFSATERFRMPGPAGTIAHAEVQVGDSVLMLSDENPQFDSFAPQPGDRTPVTLCIYVNDVDAVVRKANTHGARILRPVATQFYGDRVGFIEDPFGHRWHVATHVEDVPPEEMERRAAAAMGGPA